MWKDFKKFAIQGNVMDLAIGVIIGGAFGKIVTSLVNDVIMPLISLLTGKMDFTNLFISLDGSNYQTLAEAAENGAATLNYGMFISTVIDFFLIALSIFLVIRQINKLKTEPPKKEPTTKKCDFCITEIPIKATRCPNCTSVLETEDQPA
ncbi:MAG: large conductance mechanosensitive channel protein MscL [Clostridiales bacterium]|nr:large conductance mechanosensitive channel protein MscL [Clostridiales bacterium]